MYASFMPSAVVLRPWARVEKRWRPKARGAVDCTPCVTHSPERAVLGPAKPRRLAEPIAVSLEELVPQDHFYRHLEAKLDLSFVRDWTRELYAERGRPSIDPVVFFKLQLVMFFEGIRSERKLIETAS